MKHPALNPYLPLWEHIPDGEPHLFDGRVYVYGSHDAPAARDYCLGDYVCWSAPEDDLGAWTYEGVIYRKTDDPDNRDGHMVMIAPDVCCGPDGKYYLYYMAGYAAVSVAVCDTPGGRYRYLGKVHFADGTVLSPDSGYGQTFDPAVYVEGEDVWLYYGFGMDYGIGASSRLGGYVVKLDADMCTMATEPLPTAPGPKNAAGTEWEGHPFFEASSMRKLNGRYYLVYSSLQGHELCYGIGDAPDGPFSFGGVIISNGDVGLPGHETEENAVNYLANNHGGLVQVNGQTYIFYHRHTHGNEFSRQGCAEPVQILPDGSIPQVEVTSCGLNGGPLPAKGEYPAAIACALHGTKGIKHYSHHVLSGPEDCFVAQTAGVSGTDTEVYITNLQDGAACGYKYFSFDGPCTLALELRGNFAGAVTAHLDAEDGPAAGVVKVSLHGSCRGWKPWEEKTYSAPAEPSGLDWEIGRTALDVPAGTHALYLTFAGEGTCELRSVGFF